MKRSLLAAACILHVAACKDGTHVYPGRVFDEGRQCLGATTSVDVVDGEDPGLCDPPVCLVQNGYDGSRGVYVANMCPPYPLKVDTTGKDPACVEALAALSRDDTCLADGGSTTPIVDAGHD